MKLVRTIALGFAASGLAAGAALGQEDRMAQEEALLEPPTEITYYEVYGVDEDRDGVIDSYLFIEESDTRG